MAVLSCKSDGAGSDLKNSSDMIATITNKVFYENIPSASGLEVIGDSIYIVGDDSPYLYHLDKGFDQVNKSVISDTSGFDTGRIAKSEKLDLESMAHFNKDGRDYLLMLGSGSSEVRTKGVIAEINEKTGAIAKVNTYSLGKLYQQLQENIHVVGSGLLNIEGAAVEDDKLYLMQRAIGDEPNVLLIFDLKEFLAFLTEDGETPEVQLKKFNLDRLHDFHAGFSGAHVFDGKLFFTASVEGTGDAIEDGEVFGSYIGYIGLNELDNDNTPVTALLVHKDGTTYNGKTESLVVSSGQVKGSYKVLVVSDDDKGHSELLEVDVSFK